MCWRKVDDGKANRMEKIQVARARTRTRDWKNRYCGGVMVMEYST